ncbi:hypothetical protein PRZ48_012685 [Zasmidium cellare]|uniref:Uncharacterized protein n=1 Tax=Zasmidium cellare TaxID=395010 RepID=A0ABR0E5K6_ZASCE|nr:hypothetical protein PRZ48_012685 [Zasmidium cellare]
MSNLERPPTYSSIDPRQQKPSSTSSATTPQDSEHTLTLHRAQDHARSTGIHIKQASTTLYYVGHYNNPAQSSDIILYAGYDALGPWLAQLRFEQYSKDLRVYVGDLKSPVKDDWDVVRCADGGVFGEDEWRFECRSGNTKTRLHWTRTKDSRLGASRWGLRDFKLVDEGRDVVVAVYVEKHLGERALRGSVRFLEGVEGRVEVAGLMVLLGLLDKTRRFMGSVRRAFPNVNGW